MDCASSSIFVEVFQPFQTRLIIRPTVIRRFNSPIVREVGFGVPIRKVIDALNHQEWRDIPAFAINIHNSYCLFSIAWLNCLTSAMSIYTRNNHSRADHTHHKAGLIEVIEIAIYYTIFRLHILY
jgi:hypothetical protein